MIGVSRIRPTSFVHLAALLFVHVVEKSARYVQNCHGVCVMLPRVLHPSFTAVGAHSLKQQKLVRRLFNDDALVWANLACLS